MPILCGSKLAVRGSDGYGGLNYTIRSELNLNYYLENRSVGHIAPMNNHTESSQFLLHSLHHLDGNYTIFGKVKKAWT